MLKRFSDNLSRNVDADGLGTAEVLDAILRDEPYVFVRNVGYGENVLLLYRSESFRNRIMSGFFAPLDDVGAKAVALAAAGSMLPVHVNAMTYELLQELYAGQTVKEKMAKWMSSIGHQDRPLRLAKDNTWLAERDINEEPHRKDAASAVLCAYDANRLSQENTVRIMELHDVIVFEESRVVYARS